MNEYTVRANESIWLGRCGENLARKIIFDISDFIGQFGADGTVHLIAQRPGESTPYPCVIERDGNKVEWDITSADVAIPSSFCSVGRCELRYMVDGVVVKSRTYKTTVTDSLEQEGTPPEPQKDWVNKVLEAVYDTEHIKAAVDEYLEENPVEAGATKEEAAQIKQNTLDIKTLQGTVAKARIGTVTLLASAWTGSGSLYSQVVTISDVTENSQVDLTPSVEQLVVFYEKDLTFVTENEDGIVTVYAIGQKPANDYTVQVTITEVNV